MNRQTLRNERKDHIPGTRKKEPRLANSRDERRKKRKEHLLLSHRADCLVVSRPKRTVVNRLSRLSRMDVDAP